MRPIILKSQVVVAELPLPLFGALLGHVSRRNVAEVAQSSNFLGCTQAHDAYAYSNPLLKACKCAGRDSWPVEMNVG